MYPATSEFKHILRACVKVKSVSAFYKNKHRKSTITTQFLGSSTWFLVYIFTSLAIQVNNTL